MVFIWNKYTRIYFDIIDRAKNRTIDGYKEIHHIIPKSIGGDNDPTNLVPLTPKEHYITHLLLTKIVSNPAHIQKMWAALMCMTKLCGRDHKRYISPGSARMYEIAKTKNPWGHRAGRKQSIETRQKRSQSLKGRVVTAETRLKIGMANRGRKLPPVSLETRAKISEAGRGRILSEEHCKKISEASKRRGHNGFKGKGSRGPKSEESQKKYADTIGKRSPDWKAKQHEQVECPHCRKIGGIGGMKRYHFDNCMRRSASSST